MNEPTSDRHGDPATHGGGDARALPAQRAFVVQFHADADLARGAVTGRVEHVVSAQVTHFRTLDELQAFIARVLSEAAPPTGSAAGPTGGERASWPHDRDAGRPR